MRRILILAALLVLPLTTHAATTECGSEFVHRDVEQSLYGGIEVSGLRIGWLTTSEGADLDGYEVWRRRGDSAQRIAVVQPTRVCSAIAHYEVVVPYEPGFAYFLEVHAGSGEYYPSLVPGTSE